MHIKTHGVLIGGREQLVVEDSAFLQDELTPEKQIRRLFNGE
jgi:hypothetical protein